MDLKKLNTKKEKEIRSIIRNKKVDRIYIPQYCGAISTTLFRLEEKDKKVIYNYLKDFVYSCNQLGSSILYSVVDRWGKVCEVTCDKKIDASFIKAFGRLD